MPPPGLTSCSAAAPDSPPGLDGLALGHQEGLGGPLRHQIFAITMPNDFPDHAGAVRGALRP